MNEEKEYWTDVCGGDLAKVLKEFRMPVEVSNIPRADREQVYHQMCEAYKIITSIIDKYKKE